MGPPRRSQYIDNNDKYRRNKKRHSQQMDSPLLEAGIHAASKQKKNKQQNRIIEKCATPTLKKWEIALHITETEQIVKKEFWYTLKLEAIGCRIKMR